jgi:ABC-type phosphate transport system auxiliary subunit
LVVADVDFEILNENWTRFRLHPDNAILRVRIAANKLLRNDSETGEPSYTVLGHTVASVTVPESLLKQKGDVPVQTGEITRAQISNGTNMEIEPLETEEHWQQYSTNNGWIVMVKPEVGQVVRLQTYKEIGNTGLMEPLYCVNTRMNVRVQAVSSIKEDKGEAVNPS